MKMLMLALLIVVGCGKETKKSSEVRQNVSGIYQSSELIIKVYYDEGAEPYTDQIATVNLWSLFKRNLEALFSGKSVTVQVPMTITEMTKMTSKNKATWTPEEVLSLATEWPLNAKSGATQFQIFFVKGVAAENSSIIGFHISNTKVMVLFKDVIKSSAIGNEEIVPKYVEQATLIHEMGHALGLVNNGVPMKTSHQDTNHGAHCSNPDCVMYWSNEGASSLINYAKKISTSLDPTMFDPQCLEDARNFQK